MLPEYHQGGGVGVLEQPYTSYACRPGGPAGIRVFDRHPTQGEYGETFCRFTGGAQSRQSAAGVAVFLKNGPEYSEIGPMRPRLPHLVYGMAGDADNKLAAPPGNSARVRSSDIVRPQVHPVGAARERNIGSGIDQYPRFRPGRPYRGYSLGGERFQIASRQVPLAQLDEIDTGFCGFAYLLY